MVKTFLEWLFRKAETTAVGRWLTIAMLLLMIGFLLSEIIREPKTYGLLILLAVGGLLIIAMFRLLYLFFVTRKRSAKVELQRIVNAPPDRVFDAWSNPEQLTQWLAPKPSELIVKSLDFRPGGRFDMGMRVPDGSEHSFTGAYGETTMPTKITWKSEFTGDPDGFIETVVTFEDLEGGKTKVCIRHTLQIIPSIIDQVAKHGKKSWTTTLDQLAAFCEKAS